MIYHKTARVLIFFLSLVMITGCSDGFRAYFKRSANDKLFDTEGFKGKKRAPLYNRKYISKAKKNIAINNTDDDFDYDEEEDVEYKIPAKIYKQMYLERHTEGRSRDRGQYDGYRARHLNDYRYEDDYPPLREGARRVQSAQGQGNKSLEKEIREIKSILKKTQDELTKHKCSPGNMSSMASDIPETVPVKQRTRTGLQRKFIDQAKFKDV